MRGAIGTAAAACGACIAAMLLVAGPAAAQVEGTCRAVINHRSFEAVSGHRDAIELGIDDEIQVVGESPEGTTFSSISFEFAFLRFTVAETQFSEPRRLWGDSVRVADYAGHGVGLYRVVARAEGCTASAWVRVTGRSMLSTTAGIAGAVATGTGLVLVGAGIVRGRRGKGLVLSMVGGLVTGPGALVLAQQAGVVPITNNWLAAWTGAPVAIGGLGNRLVGLSRRALRAANGGDRARARNGGEGPGGGAEEDRRDPPRSAYALLDAPDVVVAGERFPLSTGLSPEPVPGVVAEPLVRPPSSVGPYTLCIQIVADGFSLAPGETWRRELRVTADAAYPTAEILLVPDTQASDVVPRTIQAIYSVDGQTMGMAVRSIAVVRDERLRTRAAAPPQESWTSLTIPTGYVAPDLTVRILRAVSESDGRLLWTFETPHAGVSVPDAPMATDVGAQPEAFARRLIAKVPLQEGRPGLLQFLTGVGRSVADQMPAEVWALLGAVRAAAGGHPPTVLILSQEPYVPWELAVLEDPPDPGAPFLAAQAIVGRWVLGHRRPPLPPPTEVAVRRMAVVWAEYDRQEWRLAEAEEEAKELARDWGAAMVPAEPATVLGCLEGSSAAELLHFAVHGIYNPDGPKDGLILADGSALDPLQVRGTHLTSSPFVFLNACQVGSGDRVLGDYAGMAESFLYAGASGVVAPLWSVSDAVARDIALRFYRRTLAEGASPAEVFRAERSSLGPEPRTATPLAYVFFGHPAMRLSRVREPAGPSP